MMASPPKRQRMFFIAGISTVLTSGVAGIIGFVLVRDATGLILCAFLIVSYIYVIAFPKRVGTTSTNFRFGSKAGPALDNVIVSDTVDITPAPATPEWLTISIGVPVVLVVIGVVWKWKLRKGS